MAHSSVVRAVLLGCVLAAVTAAGSGCAAFRTSGDDAARQLSRLADDVPVPGGGVPTTLEARATAIAGQLEEAWTSDLVADAREVVVEVACLALDLTAQMSTPDPWSAARDAVTDTGTDPGLLAPVSGLTADMWAVLTSDDPAGDATRYALCGP